MCIAEYHYFLFDTGATEINEARFDALCAWAEQGA